MAIVIDVCGRSMIDSRRWWRCVLEPRQLDAVDERARVRSSPVHLGHAGWWWRCWYSCWRRQRRHLQSATRLRHAARRGSVFVSGAFSAFAYTATSNRHQRSVELKFQFLTLICTRPIALRTLLCSVPLTPQRGILWLFPQIRTQRNAIQNVYVYVVLTHVSSHKGDKAKINK